MQVRRAGHRTLPHLTVAARPALAATVVVALMAGVLAVAAAPTVAQNSAPAAPAAPTVASGPTSLLVSWDEPNDNGAAITDYDVQYSTDGTNWTEWNASDTSTMRSTTITGLTDGTSYQVRVRATNSHGDSSWSPSTTRKAGGPSAPGAPTLASGNATLGVSWTAVTATPAVTDYDVRYREKDTTTWTEIDDSSPSTALTTSITGLTNAKTYEVQVRAGNTHGDGAWSPSAELPAGLPGAPGTPTVTPGDGAITVTWTAADGRGSTIDNYDVQYRTPGTSTWTGFDIPSGSAYGIPTLSNETSSTTDPIDMGTITHSYFTNAGVTLTRESVGTGGSEKYGVYKFNKALTSIYFSVLTRHPNAATLKMRYAATKPTATNLATHGTEWCSMATAPSGASHSAVCAGEGPVAQNGYLWAYTVDTETVSYVRWVSRNMDLGAYTGLSATVPATNGTAYEFQVRASNPAGYGDWSPTSPSAKAGVPAAPAAPALVSGNATMTVRWSAPDNNGSAITDYDVRHSTDGSTWTELADNTNSTATTATISTLTNGTSYQVQVRAGNTHGDGAWSPSATLKAGLPAAPPAPAVTVGNTSRSLTVMWNVPAGNGSTLTSIEVRHKLSSGSSWTQTTITDSSQTSTTLSNLTDGVSYDVQTAGTNAHGTGPWSPSTVATPGLPEAPVAPALVSGNATMTVNWSAPANGGSAITDYDVRHSTDGSTWTELADNTNSTSTTATISTLTNGTSYQVQVRAGNANGDGDWSPSATLKAGLPAKPATPTLAAANTKLTATWTAPANNGSALTGFKVRYKTSSATTWSSHTFSSTGSTTSTTITGLTNATAYDVQVLATNTHGDGPWSDSAAGTPTTTAPGKANVPSALLSANTVTLWGFVVADNGGSATTDWDVRWSSDSGTTWTEEADTTDSSNFRSLNVTDLIGGQSYVFSVRAQNANGTGEWSDSSSPAVDIPARAPAAPVPALVSGDQSLTVSWDAPSNNGAAITDYDVRYSTDGTNWMEWNASDTSTTRTATITGLTNGTSYQVQVQATNTHGDSAWSASATLNAGLPAAPAAPVLAAASATSLSVSWSAPTATGGSAITDYDVRHSTDGSTWTELADNTNSTGTTTTISTLTTGTAYQVQVRAQNANGEGPWSASATLTPGAPATPAAPTLASGNASITVSWTAPANNGSALTGFKVRHKQSSGSTWTETTISGGATTSTSLTTLTNGTSYDVQVAATNSRGDSAWSAQVAAAPGVPAVPAAPSITASGNGSLTATWTEPATNGSAITDYDVRYSSDSGANWTEFNASNTNTDTSATVTGLTNGTSYVLSVRAANTHGEGAWSPASAAAKPGLPAAPAAPTVATTNTSGSLTVTWTAPANNGSALTGFKVRRKLSSESSWTETTVSGGSTTTTTLSGLTNGALHDVQVAATNANGTGPWSPSTSAAPGVPAPPTAVTLSPALNGIAASWTAPTVTGGSSVIHYEVRYREDGTTTWTTAHGTTKTHQPGTLSGNDFTSSTNPIDIGNVSGLDVTVTNESGGLYKLGGDVARLRVRLRANLYFIPGAARSIVARVAPSKPSSSNLTTHGTQLWSRTLTSGTFDGSAWTGALPSGSYFWIVSSGIGTIDQRQPIIETEAVSTTTSRSVGGLTHGTSYEVQVRASNANGAGPWSATATRAAGINPPAAPAAPTVTAGHQKLDVSWTPPSSPDSPITDYRVEYKQSTSPVWSLPWEATAIVGPLAGNKTFNGATGIPLDMGAVSGLTGVTVTREAVGAGSNYGLYKIGAALSALYVELDGGPIAGSASGVTARWSPTKPGATELNTAGTQIWTGGSALTFRGVGTAEHLPANSYVWITSTGSYTLSVATLTLKTVKPSTTASRTITGLANNKAYDVRVAAVNVGGKGSYSPTTSGTPAVQPPDAPDAPTLVSGNATLTVSWTAPDTNGSAITDYDVRHSTDGSTWTELADNTNSTATTATISTLTNGTSYQVQVRAGSTAGDGDWSPSATLKAGLPGSPAAPVLGSASATSLSVSWSAPTATGGSAITDYDVRHSTDGSTWTELADNTNSTATTATISTLTTGTAYQVQVRAQNANGEGPWSASATLTAGTPATPAAPTLVAGNASITVSWTAPANNGANLTGFKVRHKESSGSTWTETTISGGATTTTTISTLTNGTAYDVQLAATNSRGDSGWSPTASATPQLPLPGAPAAPTLTPGNATIALSWSAPANTGGSAIVDYDVQYSTDGSTWTNWYNSLGTYSPGALTTSETSNSTTGDPIDIGTVAITGVTVTNETISGKTGFYKLGAAVDALRVKLAGVAPSTAGGSSVEARYASTAPTASNLRTHGTRIWQVTPTVDGNDRPFSGDGWTGPLPANTYFWIVAQLNTSLSSRTPVISAEPLSTGRTATITGLTNGTAYQVQVRAENGSGDGPWSASASATPGLPAVPTGVSLTSGPTALDAAWTAPANNGSAIYHYEVRYRTVGTNTWTTATGTAKKYQPSVILQEQVDGPSGNAYDMGAIADGTLDVNVDNESIGSHAGVYELEGGVARLRVKLDGNTQSNSAHTVFARVAASKPTATNLTTHGTQLWSDSQPTGGPTAFSSDAWTGPLPSGSYFWVTMSALGQVQAGRPVIETDPAVSASPRSVGGLTAGTSYEVQVRAVNANGAGPWSATVTGQAGAPAPPATPTATPASATSLTVTWTAVAGATGYTVGRCSASCDQDASWTTATITGGNTTTHTFTGLTTGTSYQVRVSATNANGSGAWSQTATRAAGAPAAPTAPTLTVGHQSLAVSWTAPANNGAALTGFKVQYKLSTAATWTAHTFSSTGSTTSTTITGLQNGTSYDVQVAATNTHGDSPWSPSASATPATVAPATPAAPVVTPGNRSLNVSWTQPNDNGSTISDYDVGYCTGTCANDSDWSEAPISSYSSNQGNSKTSDGSTGKGLDLGTVTITNVTVTKVTTGGISNVYKIGSAMGRLRVALSAKNATNGVTVTYEARYANTAPTTSNMTSHGTQLWSQSVGYGSSFNKSAWTPALPADAHFWITTNVSAFSDIVRPTIQADYPFTSTSHTVSGLTNGMTYKVRVRAENAGGSSSWSSITEQVAGVPAVPAAPTITASGNGSLTVMWTEPATNGSAITDYDVRYSSDNGANWTQFNASNTSTDTTATVTGLTNNTSYVVSVRAGNTHGDSAWSPASGAAKPGLPAAPAAPTLVPGSGSLAVSWAEPANNGSAITDYDVRYKLTSGSTWTETADTTPSTTRSVTLSPLTDNSEYEVQVRAGNAVGDGPWSASATHKAGVPAVAGTPTLTAGHTKIDVAWTAPAYTGSSLDYDVEHSTDGSTWATTGVAVTVSSRTAAITGLTNGTEYRVRVRASNSVGDGPWSTVAKATPQTQKPAAPAAPTLISGNAQLFVRWTAPSDNGSAITDYDVRYSSDSGANWTELADNTNSTATSATISTLTNGTSYQVQVRAGNARGDSPWSPSAAAKPGTPAAPAPSLVPGSASLAVSWAEPANNGNAITDYDVRYKLTSASTWTETADTTPSTTRSATLSPLTDNSEYEVQVRAGNSVGDSPWSASVTHKAGVPAVPGNPTLTPGNTRLDVVWTAPAYTGSGLDYDVEHSTDGSTWGDTGVAVTVSSRTAAITGLTNDTEYQVRVRASNSVGDGPWSAVAKATPVVAVAVAPATPSAPVVAPGNGSLAVSWTAPNNNGSTITDYDVGYCTGTCSNDGDWSEAPISSYSSNQGNSKTSDGSTGKGLDLGTVTITNVTVTKVTTGGISNVYKIGSAVGRLRVALSAKNATNTGTVTYEARYANTAPTTANMTTHGTQLWTQNVGYGSRLSNDASAWTPALPANAHFWITTTASAFSDIVRPTIQADYPFNSTSHTLTGLNNGTTYKVRVRAANAGGDSAWSATTQQVAGVPAAPAAPTITASGNGSLTATWTEPATNGSAITDYDVRYSSNNGSTWDEFNTSNTSTDTTATVTGLTNNTSYVVQVRAANARGDGPWSPASAAAKPGLPAAPAAPTLVPGDQSLTATWAAASGNGNTVTGYTVEYCSTACTTESNWSSTNVTVTLATRTATITGLTNNTAYQVRVRATNTVGSGPWSSTATHKAGVPAVPGTPTLTVGNTKIDVAWTAPAYTGSSLTYTVEHSTDGSTWVTTGVAVTNSSRTAAITGLTNGTEYRVRVRASNSVGDSPWSAEAKATPANQAPDAPAAPTLTSGNAQITANWSAPTSDGGSAITDYDVRYRQAGTSTWTEHKVIGTHTRSQNTAVSFGGNTALDMGTIGLTGVTVTKPTLTGYSNVYLLGTAVDRLRIAVSGRTNILDTATFWARYSSTAPSGDLTTAGTQIWQAAVDDQFIYNDFSGDAWTGALPANTYFWVTRNGTSGASTISITVRAEGLSTATSRAVASLTNNTEYEVQVRAENAIGAGAWSASATLKAGLPAAPAAPALDSGNAQLSVSWAAPNNNGNTITGYSVEYCSTACTTETNWSSANVTVTFATRTATITGLTNGTAYQVRVRATNSVGNGPWSATATGSPGAPAAPAAPTLASGNASLTATWTAPADNGSAITAYSVEYSSDSGATWSATNVTVTLATRTAAITGLTNGTAYQVRVRATNARGSGAWSPAATETPGKPQKPSAPTVTGASRSLSVSWTAPTENGLSITDYDVQYKLSTATDWSDHAFTGTGTTTTISGLLGATSYQVRVRASSTAGAGPWSDAAAATATLAGKPDAPAAPTLQSGASQVTVTWAAPHNGGAALSGFKARYKRSQDSTWTPHTFSSTGSTTSTTITGLTNGTAYDVQVLATNTHGDSAWSGTSSVIVGAPNAPAAPTLAQGANATSLAISWSAPGDNGATIDDYDVRYRAAGTSTWTRIFDGGSIGFAPVAGSDSANQTNDPVDFGNLSISGVLTTESLGSNSGLYKLLAAVDEMDLYMQSTGSGQFRLRTHSSKPTSDLTVGTELASATKDFRGWVGPFAANDYFWALPPSGSAAYSIRYRAIYNIDLATTTRSSTRGGLTAGTAYEVQVRAGNSRGDGAWSPASTLTLGLPGAPAPTLTHSSGQIAVSWMAPVDGGSSITGYDVQYKASTSSTWLDVTHTGTGTTATITTLTNGTAYDVRVRAANANGDGPWSTVASATPGTVPRAPAAPTVSSGNAQLSVSWTAPTYDGGYAVTDYDVQYKRTADSNWSENRVTTVTYSPGNLGTKSFGSATALDMGTISLTGVTVTKPTISGVSNVYQLGTAVSGLRVRVRLRDTTSSGPTLAARWSSTPPSSSNLGSHGTAIWTTTGDFAAYQFTGDGWTGDLPANSYFWVIRTGGNAHANPENVTPTIEAEPLSASPLSRTITGLANNTTYEVRVAAANLNGGGPWSTATTIKAGLPAAPGTPSLDSGSGSLTATWTAANGNGNTITGYTVEYSSNNGATWSSANVTVTLATRTATITGLTNLTSYQVRVRATNAVGSGPWSSTATETPGAPDAPAAPTLTSGNAQLSVSWTEPSDAGSAITDYDVEYKTTAASLWTNHPFTGTGTSTTISTLTNGTEYQVRVRATNARGTGGWSPAATDTPGKPQKPTAPTVSGASRSLSVSWVAPTENGLSITDYDVQYKLSTATGWTDHAFTGTGVSTTITGLLGATSYRVRVRASSTAGAGPWSNAAASTATLAGKPDAPAAPTVQPGVAQITVNWAAPHNGGAALTDYDVQYSSNNGSTWTEWDASTTSTNLTATITGLTTGTGYLVQVRAQNTHGNGPWSGSSSVTAGTPSTPAAPTLALGANATSLTVSWTAPADNGASIGDYDVRYRRVGQGSWTRVYDGGSIGFGHAPGSDSANQTNDPVNFGSLAISGVLASENLGSNCCLYKLLAAVDEMDLYMQSIGGQFRLRTHSSKPTNDLTVGTELAGATMNFRGWVGPFAANDYFWALPPSGSASYSGGYRAIYSIDLATTTRSYTLGGLTAGTAYEVQVRAANSRGDSFWSPAATGTPLAAPVPVLTSGPSKLIVEWDAAASNVTDYDVRYSSDSGVTWTETADTTDSTALSVTITGLVNGTSYQVQARATNAQGDSAWSASVSATAGAPSAPLWPWVSATANGTGLRVSWGNPTDNAGSALTGYDVRYRAVGTTAWTQSTQSGSNLGDWVTIGSLTGTTEYELQARAKNARGAGAWSDSGPGSGARRHPGAPAMPLRPTLTPAEGGIGVNWSAPSSVASAITDYDLRYRMLQPNDDLQGGMWRDWAFTGTNRSTTITGVDPETKYIVAVRARNAIGWGLWSDVSIILPSMVDDKYACLREGTTLLRVGAGCHIYGGHFGGGANHTFDSVEVCGAGSTMTNCVALGSSPALLAKQNETFSKVRMIAYDGTGGTRVVRTKLGSTVRGVFTVKVIPFDIGEVRFLEALPSQRPVQGDPPTLTVNTTYRLEVELTSPYNRSWRVELLNCTPTADDSCLARSWVDLSFPEGSSMTGRGFTYTFSSAPRQILDWRSRYLEFTLQTGATPGPGPITINAYGVKPLPLACNFDGDVNQIFERCYTPPTPTKPAQYNVAQGSMQMNVVATEGADPVPPDAVAATATAGGATSIAVTWAKPDSPAAPVEGYEAQYRRTGASAWTDLDAALDADATSTTITGLFGGSYEVRVRARSAFGWGDWTDPPAAVTITGVPPSAPAGLAAAAGDESVTLRWDDPSNPSATGYEYQARWAGVGWQPWAPIPNSDATTTAHTVTGLDNGTEYRFKIRAVNTAGSSKPAPLADPWFVAATPQPPPPAAPTGLAAAAGDESVALTWDDPSNPSITGYEYQVRWTGVGWQPWVSIAGGATAHTVSGLDNGVEYRFKIRAVNAAGPGAIAPVADPWFVAATPQPPPAPPATPSSVSLTRGDTTVTASWPSVAGATSYHVTYTTDGGQSWHLAALDHPAAPETTTITIDDADNTAAYIVAVRARNSAGDSEWRNSPLAEPYVPLPAAPTGLEAEAGDESVTLTWDDPSDSSITGYEYQIRWTGVGWGEWTTITDTDSDAATISFTITGLELGTEYRFKIRAINAAGTSPLAPTADPWFVSATPL